MPTPSTTPLISITTPTYQRETLLRTQHQAVLAQTLQDFEWLILDDSPKPSEYFMALDDPRIRYTHHAGPKLSIGAKPQAARSGIIAHFDDDDYYAPDYLATMLARLQTGFDITKLSGWFVYSSPHDALGYWDTANTQGLHFLFDKEPVRPFMFGHEQAHAFRDVYAGYGFSYVYRKAVWEATPFPDIDFNEDGLFIQAARQRGFSFDHFADNKGICLHQLGHGNSSAHCYSQYLLPSFLLGQLFPGMPKP